MQIKALSGIERMEVDSFLSYYLIREYKKCLSILFSQKHLDDPIRDLCLFKKKAELLASR